MIPSPPFEYAYVCEKIGGGRIQRGDVGRVFPLASVTKLLTAYATLVAVDRGMLSLETPVGIPGATVRHLLTHTSGIAQDSRDIVCEPEKKRLYSNAGFDLLGEVVESATGTAVGRWIEESLLEPLGMASTDVPASPAHSGTSCVDDLLLLGRELRDFSLISEALAREATEVQFPDVAGIVPGYGRQNPCPWSLVGEVRGQKAPHWTAPSSSLRTRGHFGVSGSFLWVDPDSEVIAAFVGEQPFGVWHRENWAQLNEGALREVTELS